MKILRRNIKDKRRYRVGSRWLGRLVASAWLLAAFVWMPAAADTPATITLGYLGEAPSSAAAPAAPAGEGVDGAMQAVADDNTTGSFVGQHFELKPVAGDPRDALRSLISQGVRLILADLPGPVLLAAADQPEAKDVTLFNIRATDDALRGADCRANVLHTAPSRAMLADALVEYLVLKRWTDIVLVVGPTEADRAYGAAVKSSVAKFGAHLVAEKAWTYEPGAKRADSGHYAVAAQVTEFTQGLPHYDILVVADEDDQFGDALPYATVSPRPIAGTQGLLPTAWSPIHQEWGAIQLQDRFRQRFGRMMTNRDYAAWLAVRAVGEAATRTASADAGQIAGYLRGDQFVLPGYKGEPLSFRPWDGQMRQAILLVDSHALVSVSPQAGFLHPTSGLDTLGADRPESQCHAH